AAAGLDEGSRQSATEVARYRMVLRSTSVGRNFSCALFHARLQQQHTTAVETAERVWPWVQPANLVVNRLRRPGPVNQAVCLLKLMRIGCGRFILRRFDGSSREKRVKVLYQSVRSQAREIPLDLHARFLWANRASDAGEHR